MPANLPCIPEFSDRRNNDGDVEELVRLGVLPICDDVAGHIWISRERCYSLCISREISYSHYHIITYTSLLLLYPVMLRYRRKIAPGLHKATHVTLWLVPMSHLIFRVPADIDARSRKVQHVTLCLELKLEMLSMIFGFPASMAIVLLYFGALDVWISCEIACHGLRIVKCASIDSKTSVFRTNDIRSRDKDNRVSVQAFHTKLLKTLHLCATFRGKQV
ncbi:hypothetical protein BJ912DRAFT_932984 [Pholiota molesta]|nr:hypothetical protein BJ912DRAFT_932984 [Pholiota molesta]